MSFDACCSLLLPPSFYNSNALFFMICHPCLQHSWEWVRVGILATVVVVGFSEQIEVVCLTASVGAVLVADCSVLNAVATQKGDGRTGCEPSFWEAGA